LQNANLVEENGGIINMNNIKTVGQLRKILKDFEDDYKLEIDYMILIPDEQLLKMSYPYPWIRKECRLEFHDVGYSDKVIYFGLYDKEER